MFILVDLIVVGIIALFTFLGYKQGLVKAAIKILSFFIAIIVALVLYKPISNAIVNNTQIDENITNTIMEKITPEGITSTDEVEMTDNLAIKLVGEATSTIEEISNAFAIKLIEVCVLLLLYIVIKIALRFILALTDIITKLPLIKQINKLGGTIYGVVKGVIMVYVILGIIYLVAPIINKNVSNAIDKSFITKNLYNNNIILKIIV